MPTLTIPNMFTPNTLADADQLDANFAAISDFVNTTGLGSDNLAANSVGSAQLANDSVLAAAIAAGAVGPTELASATLLEPLGLNDGSTVRRGKSVNTAESAAYTSTSFGSLNVPDKVSGIVLPADGIITVYYMSIWRATRGVAATGFGNVDLFLNGVELANSGVFVQAPAQAFPAPLSASSAATSTGDARVASSTVGVAADLASPSSSVDASNVSTGQMIGTGTTVFTATYLPFGGPISIFAAAGTYDIEMKYQATTGSSLFVKNRFLLVKAESFV